MTRGCPFCSQAEIKERTIAKNKYVFAFPTNIPIVPGHVLVAPVRHVARFSDATANERKALFAMIAKLQKTPEKAFRAKGFNIAWNQGAAAGQTVFHFHVHLLPRRKGDAGVTKYEPRKFLYRPRSREESPQDELKAVADTIRRAL